MYKRVGTVKGTVIASENDEEKITFLGFDRASHYLLYVLSAFEHSIPDYRWSVNIINLESGARTTLYSQYKRVRGSGCTAGHVMTEIPSMLNMWNAEEKRLLFLTSIRFNEQDDPQSVPIGFYALDLSKFDLRKGGVFAMPSMTEFYRVNRGKDVCACEANLVGRETLSPDGSRLAFAYASYCTRSSTEPITVLDLKTGHIRQLPIDWPQEINTHGVRSLTWIADGQQLAYITAHNLFTPHENEVYLHVFDLASDTVIHKAAIDLEGKSTWMDVKVCGDTVFLMGMLKQDKSSVYRLYSAPLANPEEQTELFKAYSMGNMVCETN
ncbi:MAG: hypothetical protein ABI947_20365 [Chloroflexota bacterium]